MTAGSIGSVYDYDEYNTSEFQFQEDEDEENPQPQQYYDNVVELNYGEPLSIPSEWDIGIMSQML